MLVLLLFVSSLWLLPLYASPPESSPAIDSDGQKYLARIQLHSREEMAAFFAKAEQILQGRTTYDLGHPVAFVLHGPEVELFARESYGTNKDLVDQAALLDAFGVIDVKVCATYLSNQGIRRESLPAFIDVVPYGPAYEKTLRDNGYVEF